MGRRQMATTIRTAVRSAGCKEMPGSQIWIAAGTIPRKQPRRWQRTGSHGDFALDAGDCIAADPDILARALDVNSTCSSKDGTLAGDVAIRRNSRSYQPLTKAGIETSCDRILSRASGNECPNLKIRIGAILLRIPWRHHTYRLAGKGWKVRTDRKNLGTICQHHGDPAWSVVDPLHGLYGRRFKPQPQRQSSEQIRSDIPAAAQRRGG